MTEPIVKFASAPTLEIQYPLCSACRVALEDEDGWVCPTCGTSWSYNDGDGDTGTLYEEWSGEKLDIPVSNPDDAWEITISADRKARDARVAESVARIDARIAAKSDSEARL